MVFLPPCEILTQDSCVLLVAYLLHSTRVPALTSCYGPQGSSSQNENQRPYGALQAFVTEPLEFWPSSLPAHICSVVATVVLLVLNIQA